MTITGESMNGVVKFIRTIVVLAFLFGVTGTLVDITGILGRAAVEAHHAGGIKFKRLNQLFGDTGNTPQKKE